MPADTPAPARGEAPIPAEARVCELEGPAG
jgi:hypothetical protein